MTTAKHTPGPWFFEGTESGHVAIDAAGPVRIGLLSKSGQSYPERQANARLIAAAPELLSALEWIVGRLERGGKAATSDAIAQAQAAIAKATTP